MRSFYEDTFGLERIGDPSDRLVFFKIADGHNGHTAVLALFRRDAEVSQEETIGRAGAGGPTAEHGWVQWRSLYVQDPEGNRVELVCFDPAIEKT